MVYKNNVELIGVVGNYKVASYDNSKCARFSLATDRVIKTDNGEVVKTDWHNIVAWESPEIFVNGFKKGDNVRVLGRIQYRTYIGNDGVERVFSEIVASSLNHVESSR